MKFLFALIAAISLFFQTTNLDTVRSFYPKASLSPENAEKFAKLTDELVSKDPAAAGYKAAAKIIRSKFEKGSGRRNLISTGIQSLENAVNAAPNNAELRAIRLSIQENLPKIVGYSGKISADKAFIIKNFGAQSPATRQYLKDFAAHSKSFSAAERAALK